MKKIISPVPKNKLEKELTKDKFIRKTNNRGNDLYIISYYDSPNLMREIGRLREMAFREAGGGTGKELDIDKYDTFPDMTYKQLIVWDPEKKEILGGYRYFICKNILTDGNGAKRLAISKLFNFSEKFKKEYLPYMIELGRSFVQPAFQSTSQARKGIFALDNLWDGLGALVVNNPDAKYFFGKVTMYPHFNNEARNLILFFLIKYFADKDNLVTPIEPFELNFDRAKLESIFSGNTFHKNYKILSQKVREFGENIPPLINSYMNLSPSMKTFGTVINKNFGNVEETGIMITIKDLYTTKVDRHISTYYPGKS